MGIEDVGLELHLDRWAKRYILYRLAGTGLGCVLPVVTYLLTRSFYLSVDVWIAGFVPIILISQVTTWNNIWKRHKGEKVKYTNRSLLLSVFSAGYFWSPLVLVGVAILWAIVTGNSLA